METLINQETGEITYPDRSKLFGKMAKVMGQLKRLPKRGHNAHFGYDFVTDGDVADAVREALAKEGVAFFANIAELQSNNGRTTLGIDFTFGCNETGASITCRWYGEGIDKQDKGIAKAATSCEKYFLLKTFILSTGDDPDPDATTETIEALQSGNGKETTRPYDPETLKKGIAQRVAKYQGKAEPTDKQRDYAVISLDKVTLGDDKARHTITLYLFGKDSAKDLTAGECSALIEWIGAKPDEYEPDPNAVEEAKQVIRAYQVEQGQAELPL